MLLFTICSVLAVFYSNRKNLICLQCCTLGLKKMDTNTRS